MSPFWKKIQLEHNFVHYRYTNVYLKEYTLTQKEYYYYREEEEEEKKEKGTSSSEF